MGVKLESFELSTGQRVFPISVGNLAGCDGCVGGKPFSQGCDDLPPCDGIIWAKEPAAVAPARLTKPEIDDLKKRAIELYGATWLHHFGSFVEAEVYQRLGHPMPEDEHGQTTPT